MRIRTPCARQIFLSVTHLKRLPMATDRPSVII